MPPATELKCELRAGGRIHTIPVNISDTDVRAGGAGRLDGGRLSERVDFMLDGPLEEVEVHLMLRVIGPWWRLNRSEHLLTRCFLHNERWGDPDMAGSTGGSVEPLPCALGSRARASSSRL